MKRNITPLRRILKIDGGPAMLGSGYVWQQNSELRERKEKEHLR